MVRLGVDIPTWIMKELDKENNKAAKVREILTAYYKDKN